MQGISVILFNITQNTINVFSNRLRNKYPIICSALTWLNFTVYCFYQFRYWESGCYSDSLLADIISVFKVVKFNNHFLSQNV